MTTIRHNPFNWNELRDLIYRATVLKAYSSSTLLPYEGDDWNWIAHQIARELSIHAPGPDDLDNWDRSKRFLEGPVLMLP
jgi:hypothetical protein